MNAANSYYIQWSGYTWDVKSGIGEPGPNNWLASSSNVWVDTEGNLHLKIVKNGDKWYCSEIYFHQSLGYGEYTFKVSTNVENFDKNIVLGLFTYETDSKEIDLEFSRWGISSNPVGWYVVQPSASNSRYNFPLNLNGNYSTHKFIWNTFEINFMSYHGHNTDYLINQWKYNGPKNPPAGNEKVHINFWLYNSLNPFNQQEAEVIIKSFTYKSINEKPEAPSDIIAVANDKNSIKLVWKDLSYNEDGFYIYCRPWNSNSFSKIAQLDKNTTSFVHENLYSGKEYSYKTVAYNSWGTNESSIASTTTGIIPNAPSDLKAFFENDKIKLNWNDNSSNENKFQIQKKNFLIGFAYWFYASVSANTTNIIIDDFEKGNTYQFRVRAENEFGESNWIESNVLQSIEKNIGTKLIINDKDGKVSNAEIYIKKFNKNKFELSAGSTTNNIGECYLENLSVGDEILVRNEKKELAYMSNKEAHDKVNDQVFNVYFDNGLMDEDGNYNFTKILTENGNLNIELNHPIIGYNLIVSLNFKDFEEDFSSAFKNASDYLYDVTDGQAFLNKVFIYKNGVNFRNADVKVFDALDEAAWPNANVFGIYKRDNFLIDYRIKIGRSWAGPPGSSGYDRTIIHEFGHYALGFYDEYLSFKKEKIFGGNWDYRDENRDEFPDNYGLMDYQYSTSEMSSFNDYNKEYPSDIEGYKISMQYGERNMACWKWFEEDVMNKAKVPIFTPSYGYFENGNIIGGQDREGPFKIPTPYITNIEYDQQSKSARLQQEIEVHRGNKI